MVKKETSLVIIFLFIINFISANLLAQEVNIILGPDEIAANEVFPITISIEDAKIHEYDKFPEIPGFVKRGTSSSSSINIINGKRTSTHSITQNYIPSGEGSYTLKPFYMNINGEVYSSGGKSIKVNPPLQSRRHHDPFSSDPFDDFFGRHEEEEFVDVEEDAFFALTTDKDQVYVGEGFNVVLAFYLAEKDQMYFNFYEVGKQLSDILKKLKPASCWEENFNIDNISGTRVTINNKVYQQYKIYQASFFPLNTEPVVFPSVGLQMIKYQIAKRRHFFGRNKKESFKTYNTQLKTVNVVDLPPHPLKNQVAVGVFKLQEKITSTDLQTGQSFTYNFNISGEGNISGIHAPKTTENKKLELYPPNANVNIRKNQSKVTGNKAFSYYGIPKEPGTFDLGDYFQWIYFNTSTSKYDTLTSTLAINVTGQSKKNEYIASNDLGSFYDIIESEDNQLISRKTDNIIKIFANIFIVTMLVLTAVFIFRK